MLWVLSILSTMKLARHHFNLKIYLAAPYELRDSKQFDNNNRDRDFSVPVLFGKNKMPAAKKLLLTWFAVQRQAQHLASNICNDFIDRNELNIFPVPRGGVPVALMLSDILHRNHILHRDHAIVADIVEHPAQADIIVDDLIDSGATRKRFQSSMPHAPFYALYDKSKDFPTSPWLVFPWEKLDDEESETIEDNVVRILQSIGEDVTRPGLIDTPKRYIKALSELTSGYTKKLEDLATVFEEPADEMVVLRDIEFTSTCEHHLLPFLGRAHIGYVPNGKVIGISKLARILDMFAKRLQIQERIGEQVTAAINEILDPLGAACVIESKHLCMVCRGVQKQNSIMATSSMTGVFKTKPEARQEFLQLIRG